MDLNRVKQIFLNHGDGEELYIDNMDIHYLMLDIINKKYRLIWFNLFYEFVYSNPRNSYLNEVFNERETWLLSILSNELFANLLFSEESIHREIENDEPNFFKFYTNAAKKYINFCYKQTSDTLTEEFNMDEVDCDDDLLARFPADLKFEYWENLTNKKVEPNMWVPIEKVTRILCNKIDLILQEILFGNQPLDVEHIRWPLVAEAGEEALKDQTIRNYFWHQGLRYINNKNYTSMYSTNLTMYSFKDFEIFMTEDFAKKHPFLVPTFNNIKKWSGKFLTALNDKTKFDEFIRKENPEYFSKFCN